eukprot:SAG31_NODE_21883_length_538_cov_1.496583_1_plen_121_part_10
MEPATVRIRGYGDEDTRKESKDRWRMLAKGQMQVCEQVRLAKVGSDPARPRYTRNSAEQTAAALADAAHRYRIYTDGGCDGNGAGGDWGVAAYGAHVDAPVPLASRSISYRSLPGWPNRRS